MPRVAVTSVPTATELTLPDWSARSVAVRRHHPVAVTCLEGELLVTMENDPIDHVLAAGETFTVAGRGRLVFAALGPSRVRLERATVMKRRRRSAQAGSTAPHSACATESPMATSGEFEP